jgi:hypothetical protein
MAHFIENHFIKFRKDEQKILQGSLSQKSLSQKSLSQKSLSQKSLSQKWNKKRKDQKITSWSLCKNYLRTFSPMASKTSRPVGVASEVLGDEQKLRGG